MRALGPLLNNTTYYWRINAKNNGGTSGWSDTWSFTTIPAVTGTPTLVSPVSSIKNQPISFSLLWNAVAGASTYRVQLSTAADFNSNIVTDDSTLTTASMAIELLSNNTTYYWRVNAKNIGGTSEWSEIRNFTTLPVKPGKVTLIAPDVASVILVDSMTFIWAKPTTTADTFCLEVYADSLMGEMVFSDSTITDTLMVQNDLEENISYWWRVMAHNSAGWGTFSELRKFSVDIHSAVALPEKYSCILGDLSKAGSYIKYSLPSGADVSIKLYTIQGKLVKSIVNMYQNAGYYRIPLEKLARSKGYYILMFEAGDFRSVRKIVTF
jgi:hypothetical protein